MDALGREKFRQNTLIQQISDRLNEKISKAELEVCNARFVSYATKHELQQIKGVFAEYARREELSQCVELWKGVEDKYTGAGCSNVVGFGSPR